LKIANKYELPKLNRIVVIAEYFPPRLGGDRRIFELMKRLSRKYEIHFLTLPQSYTLFIRRIESYRKEEDCFSYEGMTGHRLALPKPLLKTWNRSFVLSFALTLPFLCFQTIKKVVELKPDVIIINNTSIYTGLIGFVCSKVLNKKLLVEYNDLQALYTIELVRKKINKSLLPVLGRILVLIEDVIVKHGWKVTAITGFIKDYAFVRNTRRDIVVISDGVDTDLFDPGKRGGIEIRSKYGIGEAARLCVYTGRIDECAGAELILKTAELLKSERNVKFMVVGEGDTQIVNEFSKCDNVILTGLVSKESVPDYLAAADIVLVPFPDSVASHSVSPLKLFEALAMEKKVIASEISGIREIVGQDFDGILVPANPARWASAVKELASKRTEPVHGTGNNRVLIREKYDWNHLAAEFGKVLEEGKRASGNISG
jgi:glycosyltransferase involved in cell wall biosynthesis